MTNYSVFLPNYSIGENCLDSFSDVVSKLGKKAFLIYGNTALSKVSDKLYKAVETAGVDIVSKELYGHECTFENMDRLCQIGKESSPDFIIGVGGGKSVDTAKGVAEKLGVPIVTVPTIASNSAGITALSVVYNEDGSFNSFYVFKKPVFHCFIDSEIIANAPVKYMRAGIGDTLAKHYECMFASKNDLLSHSSALGRQISYMCAEPLLMHSEKALSDCTNNTVSFDLEQAALSIIISTGLVSILVLEQYNGAVAHSVFYGFTSIKGFEEHYLHGDAVGYGVLVQLALEENDQEFIKIYNFCKKIGIPTKLADFNLSVSDKDFDKTLDAMLNGPDMNYLPYKITKDNLLNAILKVEKLGE